LTTFPSPVLQAQGLSFSYPSCVLFNDFNASIPPGVTLIWGGDGCGKTTLLRLLAGELPAAAGALHIHGFRLGDPARAYQQQMFWVDPRSESFDQISPLAYFESVRLRYARFDDTLLAHITAGLSLTPFLEKPLFMLSTGSKRKVWLAAALASGAAVTLLDEPFAALDQTSIRFLLDLLVDASAHRSRAWVVAAYAAPGKVPLACVIELPERA
jgi:ABC-type multidrug transport system ATPase subunit